MNDRPSTPLHACTARAGWGRRQMCVGLMVAVALSACSDGYPTSDVSPLTAEQMNRPQLLKYLRQLGEAGHQGFTWRYELHDDCHLAVVGREAGRADDEWDASLRGAVLDIDFDEVRKAYDVGISPKTLVGSSRHVLYRADKWTDAIFAMAFFQKMQMNCVGQGALAPV